MAEIKYSEKEIAILNGMINLIKNGANPYLVKVSDIAESAGVGKGTIYDYFETKEEVILKAIFFNIGNEIDLLRKRIDEKNGFKEKYYEILNSLVENVQNKFSTFNILLSAGKLPEFSEASLQEDFYFHHLLPKVQRILDNLLTSGFQEGIIKEVENKYYQRMVVKSSLVVFGNYLAIEKQRGNISMQEAMDYSYKIIIKSLN